jgi:hypothetical protein
MSGPFWFFRQADTDADKVFYGKGMSYAAVQRYYASGFVEKSYMCCCGGDRFSIYNFVLSSG